MVRINCRGVLHSYIFRSGTASHIVSEAQNLPVLFIVWNNGVWNAVKSATKSMHPGGHAAETDTWAMANLSQGFSYEMVCQASGVRRQAVTASAWKIRRRWRVLLNAHCMLCRSRSGRHYLTLLERDTIA